MSLLSEVSEDSEERNESGHDHEKCSSLEERNSPTLIGDDESKQPDGCSSAGGSDAAATLIPISDKESSPEDVLKRLLKQTSSNEPRSDYEKALMPCNFPERLMDLLEKKVAEDAMWFLPGSVAWAYPKQCHG